MQNYTKKTDEHLEWEDARDLIRAEIRRVTRRVTNMAYAQLDELWSEALAEGTQPDITVDYELIQSCVYDQLKQLNPGDADA